MPKLSELTDVNYTGEYDPMGNALPVEKLYPELQRVYVNEPSVEQPSKGSVVARSILDKLFGQTGERYQLWPEKIVRDALSAAHDVKEGKELSNIGLRREDVTDKPVPQRGDKPDMPGVLTSVAGGILTPTASSPQDSIIEKAQAISALAGTGGLAGGAEGAVLNATPSLRPALKHKERLYKGKPGQEHQDIIPDSLYNDFQKKAMSGEDLAEYNFGFINDKGHFMSREDALKYGIDNGIIDPHSGKYGALTTTLLADSSKPGTAIEAMAKTNPFFSALEHNVSNISQGKMNGDAWLGTLSNKPGVKPEELDWTGLRSFLEENKGKPVTKQQIEQHLAENKIELKEVVKGTTNPEAIKAKEAFDAYGKELGDKYDLNPLQNLAMYGKMKGMKPEEVNKYVELQKAYHDLNVVPKTKYHSYQLPGGENYREVLLTLPKSGRDKFEAQQNAIIAKREKIQDEFDALYGKEDAATLARRKELTKEFNNTTDELQKLDLGLAERNNFGDYKSSHWDEPNILAHMRMNDRTIDGKKSLHLEEIQSDWHQAGRDKGYKATQKEKDRLNELVAKKDKGILSEAETAEAKSLAERLVKDGVPDAPFKKTWHELALKRALREAAEKGYDRLSWTPGEAQAARYDLSKQIDKLSAKPILDQHGLKYEVKGWKGDNDHFNQVVTEADLPNAVGKEMAKKIINESEGKKPVEYKGLDLKIGGEGMKGFYDNMIPKALEKLGKEHGVKVVKGQAITHKGYPENISVYDKNVNHVKDFKTMDEARAYLNNPANGLKGGSIKGNKAVPPKTEPVYYIDIPQSLRNTATGKGFPLFAKGGYMLQPVDYEPEFK